MCGLESKASTDNQRCKKTRDLGKEPIESGVCEGRGSDPSSRREVVGCEFGPGRNSDTVLPGLRETQGSPNH